MVTECVYLHVQVDPAQQQTPKADGLRLQILSNAMICVRHLTPKHVVSLSLPSSTSKQCISSPAYSSPSSPSPLPSSPPKYRLPMSLFTLHFQHYGRHCPATLLPFLLTDLHALRAHLWPLTYPNDGGMPVHIGLVTFDILVFPGMRGEVSGRDVGALVGVGRGGGGGEEGRGV